MSIDFRYESKHSAIIVRAYDILTLKDIIDFLAAVAGDDAIPAEHVTLFDASGVTAMNLSSADIEEISLFTQAHPSNKIIARKLAIVTRGREETQLAEEYERFAATFKETTIVFYHRDIACNWLGIPGDI